MTPDGKTLNLEVLRLVEKGWLQAGTEAGKTRYTTKSPIPLEGTRRHVWNIAAPHFWPDN